MNIDPKFQSKPEIAPDSPLISVVVPVHNEAPNIPPLISAITASLAGIDHEIVYVDDGSSDASPKVLAEIAAELPTLVRVRHKQSCGQSAAIITGVKSARGIYIATLDGDGQNDPADIPKLLDALEADPSLGMVSGVRVKRKDTASRRLASRLGNGFRNLMLGDGASDTGCGLKAFRRHAFLDLPYFDHIHRFLIALVQREGWRVHYVPVNHRPRLTGRSKYTNFGRLLVSVHDLLGVRWLQRRYRGQADIQEL
jgi:dolichol-phosphate mannosyltransferase